MCDSVELHKRLKADGVDCELIVVEGADHGFDTKKSQHLRDERKKALKVADRRLKAVYDS